MGGIPQYNLVPRGKEGREQAENSLHEAANKPLTNTNFEINATISNESIGKLTSGNALGETFRALHDSGFCDKDTAYQIHMTAASNLPELFTKAPKKEDQEVYHDGEHRESATHLFCPFRTEGINKPVTAEISVIAFKGDDNKRIYSLGMRVRPPLPSSGISQ